MVDWEFESDLRKLAPVRSLIRQTCLDAWKTEENEALDNLLLAVQEAATNIIRHGYCDSSDRKIHIRIETTNQDVTVILTYPGRSFDPQLVPAPCFEGKQEGGYGVYLIKQLVDSVRYCQDTNGLRQIFLHQNRTSLLQGDSSNAT